ncbi:MAG: TauD/TfdA dioxygenase family protein [Acidobacteriota bacterium]
MTDAAVRTGGGSVALDIRPLGKALGAEVRGLDLSQPLTPATWAAIRAAFLQYQMLAFRDQALTEPQQIAFSEHFGRLQVHVLNQYHREGNPAVIVLTNIGKDGKPIGEHPDPGAVIWHTDGSWSSERPLATFLYGIEIPRTEGDTLFANMYAAYDGLAPELRRRIEGLKAVHDLNWSRQQTTAKKQMTEEQKRAAPPVEQPMVRVHPETGRKAIYLGQHASHIAGMPVEEGRALVRAINAHATKPEYVYRHRWLLHDFVMWDNRCVMHAATDFDWINDRRVIQRTTVLGERLPERTAA